VITLTEHDGSVRPLADTGFRMKSTEPFVYTPKPNPPTQRFIDYVNEGDIATRKETRLRGIFHITVDEQKAEARIVADIRHNMEFTNGTNDTQDAGTTGTAD